VQNNISLINEKFGFLITKRQTLCTAVEKGLADYLTVRE